MQNLKFALSGIMLFALVHNGNAQVNKSNFIKTQSGVKVSFKGSESAIDQDVYLDVITDKIIRVTALPYGDPFPSQASLVVVDSLQRQLKSFHVQPTDSTINLTTSDLIAKVSLVSGKVEFFESSNKTDT